MSKDNNTPDTDGVSAHIGKLPVAIRPAIEMLRRIILSTDPLIGERIKWNSPSFFYMGELPPFDPKTYKRELIVMNLHKGRLMLVLPSGAKVTDNSGLLEGDYKDGRRLIYFKDMADVMAKEKAFRNIIKDWLSKVNE